MATRSSTASSDQSVVDLFESVFVWTGASCPGNPGIGGYGAIISQGDSCQETSGGYRKTTSNRMAMMAVVAGLRKTQVGQTVNIYASLKTVPDAMTKGWAAGWRVRGWRCFDGSEVENTDLWEQMLDLSAQRNVRFTWLPAGSPSESIRRCYVLANRAARGRRLGTDVGYESRLAVADTK